MHILSNGGAYQLNITPQGWIDVEEFRDEMKKAEKALHLDDALVHYLKAQSLYQGDFLEDDPYTQWCGNVRENLKKDYLNGLTKVIVHNWNTRNILVQVLDNNDDYATIEVVSVSRPTNNQITLVSSELPGGTWTVLLTQVGT